MEYTPKTIPPVVADFSDPTDWFEAMCDFIVALPQGTELRGRHAIEFHSKLDRAMDSTALNDAQRARLAAIAQRMPTDFFGLKP